MQHNRTIHIANHWKLLLWILLAYVLRPTNLWANNTTTPVFIPATNSNSGSKLQKTSTSKNTIVDISTSTAASNQPSSPTTTPVQPPVSLENTVLEVQKIKLPENHDNANQPPPIPNPAPVVIAPKPTPTTAVANSSTNQQPGSAAEPSNSSNLNARELAIRQRVTRQRNQKTSVMWTTEEFKRINAALQAFSAGAPYERTDEFLNENQTDADDKEEDTILYSVYLASLIYISPNNWSIWINNKKISNENASDNNEFKIMEITEEYVTIHWQISALKWDLILNQAGQSLAETPESEQESGRMQEDVVKIFTLKPNQTYIPVNETVIEGKVKRF